MLKRTKTQLQLKEKRIKFSPMDEVPAIKVRIDMVNGQFDLKDEDVAYMKLVREQTSQLAKKLAEEAPKTSNIGRIIAATDALQQVKNLYCDAAILGREEANRRSEKTE